MSGIEVVGLLLGSIPLVISALEHYKEGIDVLNDIRNYHSTLKSLKTKLIILEENYRGTVKRLLLPELSSFEVHALFPEPGEKGSSALWGTKYIEGKLLIKLGAKFHIFMDVVADVRILSFLRIIFTKEGFQMNAIMVTLMDKLDIDMDGKVRREALIVYCSPPLTQHANISCSQNGNQEMALRRAFKIASHGSGDGSADP